MDTPLDARTVSLLLAPDFVGIVISYFLYGALFLQLYTYITHFRRDSITVAATVYSVFVAETLLVLVTTRVVYALLCEGWGDVGALARLDWVDAFIPILAGLISSGVQIFYAFRIYILGRKTTTWTIAALATLPFMAASSIAAFYAGFDTITQKSLQDIQHVRPAIIVWLVCSVVCDTMISISMAMVLDKSRKMLRWTNNQYTEQRLTQIIRLSMEAGALTMAGTVIMLIFFFALPQSRLFTMMGFINSKLYSNSLMAQLNSRVTDASRDASRGSHSGSGNGAVQNSGGVDRRVSAAVFNPSRDQLKSPRKAIAVKRMVVEGFDDAGNSVPMTALKITGDTPSSISKDALAREESHDETYTEGL